MSSMEEEAQRRMYMVLVNDEGQYSLWPQGKAVPNGWRAVGQEGSQEECSSYVDSVWTDMRPLSLRRAMELTQT